MSELRVVPPGSVIGILGGGQLGRMTAMAAASLGYRCHVYCPDEDAPAFAVSAERTRAGYDDGEALGRFAGAVDVATCEFENVPVAAAERVAETVLLRPGTAALAVAQDRIAEKTFLNRIGVATTAFAEVDSAVALGRALARLGPDAILKTVRLGYDGKGQVAIGTETDADAAWRALGVDRAILEARVAFEREVSVVLARGADGRIAAYDAVENVHEGGILRTTRAPARLSAPCAAEVVAIGRRIAEALDIVGLLAVEMFLAGDGRLLVNEIAPRPHNSGHWTIDACPTSQFEQLVRAICGLPLGTTARLADAEMTNLLGAEAEGWAAVLADPSARLHLYGKTRARPGRKMGHVTRIYPRSG